ncbi:MAG: hypothetical protein ACOY33_02015 [Pseudomonadota bacterium]
MSQRIVVRLAACSLWLAFAGTAAASYNEECRQLAMRLDSDPGSLKVGELDLLKSCLSDLQRSIVLGEPPPEKGPPPACETKPPECPVCAACPAAETVRQKAPSPPPPVRKKEREREDDRRLKPYLPQY